MKTYAWGICTAVFLLVVGAGVFAQSNEVIDTLLAQETAQPSEVSYVVLVAGGAIDEGASVESAFQAARDAGFFGETADRGVHLGQLSYLLMRSFDVRGGIMYSILPSPRYATRELAFHGLIAGSTHPDRLLSGFEALQIVERFLNWRTNG